VSRNSSWPAVITALKGRTYDRTVLRSSKFVKTSCRSGRSTYASDPLLQAILQFRPAHDTPGRKNLISIRNIMSQTLRDEGGIFVIPVLINNAITLSFAVDSGATDVTLPEDVYKTLLRTNTISTNDEAGSASYHLADGSQSLQKVIRLRVLKVGEIEVRDVTATVAREAGSLLLGQSFLSRFKSWSIDNERHVLHLK
jgi:clan AA aspartic protease (TIGR02281 family)